MPDSNQELPSLRVYLEKAKEWYDAHAKVGQVSHSWDQYKRMCQENYEIMVHMNQEQRDVKLHEEREANTPAYMAVSEFADELTQAIKQKKVGAFVSKIKKSKQEADRQAKQIVSQVTGNGQPPAVKSLPAGGKNGSRKKR